MRAVRSERVLLAGLAGAALLGLPRPSLATTAADVGGCAGTVPARIVSADPSNYRTELAGLGPGDLLRLAAGTYPDGLPFSGHQGQPDDCIIVEGPDVWPPTAVFTVRTCCNTVSFRDSSYLVIRNLEIDGTGDTVSADGVKAEPGGPETDDFAHHITLENLFIHDHDLSQQTVCISTKIRAWNWVVRNSVLDTCGTGVYFGNSDGEEEFVAGLFEHNLVVNAVGYDMQVKHQNGRATALAVRGESHTTTRVDLFRHLCVAKPPKYSRYSGGSAP